MLISFRRYGRAVGAIVVVCFGYGCSMLARQNETRVDDSTTLYASRVLVTDRCRLTGAGPEALPLVLAPIVLAILPKIVEAGIDLGAKALKDYRESFTGTDTARGAEHLYVKSSKDGVNHVIGCITYVRGRFGDIKKRQPISDDFWKKHEKTVLDEMQLMEAPDFYFEANLVYASDGTAFRLKPQQLYFGHPVAKRTGSGGEKDLAIMVTFQSVSGGAKEAAQAFASESLAFKRIKVGSNLGSGLDGGTTGWMPLLPVDKAKFDALRAPNKFSPVSITVTVSETEEGGDLLLKASEALSASKADLTKAIVDGIKKLIEPEDKGAKKK